MAQIVRKLRSQERDKVIARSGMNTKSAGFIPHLGPNGVSFTVIGTGTNEKYSFCVGMTFAEWIVLKRDLDNMARSYDDHKKRAKEIDAKVEGKARGSSRRVTRPKTQGVRGRSG